MARSRNSSTFCRLIWILLVAQSTAWLLGSTTIIIPRRAADSSLQLVGANKSNNININNNPQSPPSKDSITNGALFASSPPKQEQQQRKQKKNKYAKFSKVGTNSTSEDPLEALIRESEAKLRQIQEDQEAKKRPPVIHTSPDADKRLEYPNNKNIDPYDPATFGYVEIGTILGAHGVHGWCKVEGCTDFPERLTKSGMHLHLKPLRKRAPRKATLANGKMTGTDSFLVQLQGVYSRIEADKLRGGTLYYATQQDSVKDKDDILVSDLVGMKVVVRNHDDQADDQDERIVGTVGGVVLAEEMCAIPGLGQDMLEVVIERSIGDPNNKPGTPNDLVLVPMVPEIVTKVDIEAQRVWIDPPAGLLNLTYVREEKVRIKGFLPPAKD